MIKHPYNVPLTEQCIRLLAHRHISSKDELKHELIQLGFLDISLSSISFMLIGIGAKKVTDTNGRKYYCLRSLAPTELNRAVKSKKYFSLVIAHFF